MNYKIVLLLFLLGCFGGCLLEDLAPISPDHVFNGHGSNPDGVTSDTASQQLLDTCINLEEETDPPFIAGGVRFDIFPLSNTWYFYWKPYPSLDSLLKSLGHPYHIYQEGNSLAVIIDGTNNFSQYGSKIWTYDGDGHHQTLTFGKQAFFFMGALTFDEYMEVIDKYPSVYQFNFLYTSFDSLQYEQAAVKILGHCKKGRYWADFRHNAFEISDTIITQFHESKWQVVSP